MSSTNATINLINIELAELRGKQKTGSLSAEDLKKLHSLIKMKKDLYSTKNLLDNEDLVDESIFTDEEILKFLENREYYVKLYDKAKKTKKE